MHVPPPVPGGSPEKPGGAPASVPDTWAWANAQPAPVAPERWIETRPLPYHQLLLGVARYRWWKPLLALALGALYYLTLSIVFGLLVMAPYFVLSGTEPTEDAILALALPDTRQPLSLVLTLGSVALLIPAVWLAMLSTGLTPIGRIWSVALRIRWRLLRRTVVPALVALLVMNVVGISAEIALQGIIGTPSEPRDPPPLDFGLVAWSLAIVLVLVPLQATAEEVVFRGALMQTIGAWLGRVRAGGRLGRALTGPWPVIVIPSLLFGFAHIYDIWGWMSVVVLAAVAGWLTWRTGGLEAAISIHVINNWVAFALMAFAVGGETKQTASGAGPGSVVGAVAGLLLYAWWVDRRFRNGGGPRTRIDYVRDERPMQVPAGSNP